MMFPVDRYLIVSREEFAAAINGSMGSCATPPTGDIIDSLGVRIAMALTRAEGFLEVDTLVRGTFTETFYVPPHARDGRVAVRLRNAFLDEGQNVGLQSIARDGLERVDHMYGMVYLSGLRPGTRHTVTYTAGFEPDPATRVLKDVPAAIRDVAITAALIWFRAGVMAPKAGPGVSYTALVRAAIRELQSRGHNTFERPRSPFMVWTDHVSADWS